MAVSYAPTKLRVPAGFQNLLEGLAREVLREQPPDIVSFAAQYFKNKLVLREETGKDDAKRGEQLEKMMKGEDVDIDPNDPSVQAAATKIQASFRGHKAREEVKKHKEEEEAAIKIQATFRGHVTREQVKEIKVSKSDEKVQPSEKEAEKVTTGEPKDEQSGKDQAEVVDIDLNDPEVQGAAVKIQSSFRGHKAREELKATRSGEVAGQEQTESPPGPEQDSEVKPEAQQTPADDATPQNEGEVIDIDLEDPEVQKAASKIQASFRGKLSRSSKERVAKPTDEGQTGDKAQVETQEKSDEVPVEQSQEPAAEEQNQETAEPNQEPAAEQSQEPEEQSQEPEDSSQQPIEPSQEPAEQSQQPEEQSEEPVEQSQEPSEDTSEQPHETEQSNQELEEPKQEADEVSQEGVEQSQEPDVASQGPSEDTQKPEAPSQKQEASNQEQDEPSQEQEASNQEQDEPSQEQEASNQETAEQ